MKHELNKELHEIKSRIKHIRSFTSYGQTLSGSYVKDQIEISKLTARMKEILSLLKA